MNAQISHINFLKQDTSQNHLDLGGFLLEQLTTAPIF
jgi:hypothetical protein